MLTAVKQEVERWQLSGAAMDVKHQQVEGGIDLGRDRDILPTDSAFLGVILPLPVTVKSVPSYICMNHDRVFSPFSSIVLLQVLGEVLLSAGYMSYLGPLPGSYRKQVWIVLPGPLTPTQAALHSFPVSDLAIGLT